MLVSEWGSGKMHDMVFTPITKIIRRVRSFSALNLTIIAMMVAGAMTTQSLLAQQSAEKYQRGVEAFANGEYETAANIWLIEAYEGSTDAQFNLGVMYIEGKGVEQSRDEAVFWFTKAAQQGHREAQYNLGHLLLEEREDPEKIKQAIEWWRQSSVNGFAIAQYNYARALFYGVGTDKDIVTSKTWFDRAAQGGEQQAALFLEEHAGVFAAFGDLGSQVVEVQPETTTETESGPESENVAANEVESEAPTEENAVQEPEQEDTTASSDEADSSIPEESAAASGSNDVDSTTHSEQDTGSGETETNTDSDTEQAEVIYALIKDDPVLVYSRFNTRAPVIDQVGARILLRVVEIGEGWIKVQVPGGLPGWVKREAVTESGDFVEVAKAEAMAFADPTDQSENNLLGSLPEKTKMMVLMEQDSWLRVQLPESISGWLESDQVNTVNASAEKIAAVWQAQRVNLRLERMA